MLQYSITPWERFWIEYDQGLAEDSRFRDSLILCFGGFAYHEVNPS